MDLGSIRQYVRDYLESDAEELPDPLIDMWISDGFTQVMKRESHWPWLETSWQVDSQPGVGDYEITPDRNVAEVTTAVTLPPNQRFIQRMGHQDALVRFGNTTQSTPVAYSVRAGHLYLWPTPTSIEQYLFLGYRKSLDWMGGDTGAEPDCPVEFHSLIVRYAIACAYEQQDDTEMATFNKQHFDTDLSALWARTMQADDSHPIILGGAGRYTSYPSGPGFTPPLGV